MIDADLARRVETLRRERTPFVHATVVRVAHPTSSRPGDSALVLADGAIDGFVGGVCAQASLRLHAARALETGEPILLRIVPGDIESVQESEGTVTERNPCLSGGTIEIFLDPQLPAPRVIVVGETPIAQALERIARAAGSDAGRAGAGDATPSAGDAGVIVASHGDGEEAVLATALIAGVPYVALVSSATRGAAVVASLDVPDELRDQVHTPAGLRLGGREPAEIAIAILAELIAERHAHPDVRPARAPVAAHATARDPICGMEVLVSEATLHLDHDGERVYFCRETCRSTYAERYASDAGSR